MYLSIFKFGRGLEFPSISISSTVLSLPGLPLPCPPITTNVVSLKQNLFKELKSLIHNSTIYTSIIVTMRKIIVGFLILNMVNNNNCSNSLSTRKLQVTFTENQHSKIIIFKKLIFSYGSFQEKCYSLIICTITSIRFSPHFLPNLKVGSRGVCGLHDPLPHPQKSWSKDFCTNFIWFKISHIKK